MIRDCGICREYIRGEQTYHVGHMFGEKRVVPAEEFVQLEPFGDVHTECAEAWKKDGVASLAHTRRAMKVTVCVKGGEAVTLDADTLLITPNNGRLDLSGARLKDGRIEISMDWVGTPTFCLDPVDEKGEYVGEHHRSCPRNSGFLHYGNCSQTCPCVSATDAEKAQHQAALARWLEEHPEQRCKDCGEVFWTRRCLKCRPTDPDDELMMRAASPEDPDA